MAGARWLMCGASLARCSALGIPRMDDVARDLGIEVAVDGPPPGWKGSPGSVVTWGHRKFVTRMLGSAGDGTQVVPWHDPAPMSFSQIGERFRRHLLYRDFVIVPLSDVPGLDRGHDLLLRAEAGSRVHPAVVVGTGSLSMGVAAHPKLGLIPPATPCVVARAHDLEEEHRAVVVDGTVVSVSRHREGKHHRVSDNVPPSVRAAAVAVAAEPGQPAAAYVVDLGVSAEGKVGVTGFGPFSTAELNASDPAPLLVAATAAASRLLTVREAA